MARLSLGRTDPWWDMEGRTVRRERLRRRIVGGLAFVLAITACGFTVAVWFRQLEPAVRPLLGL